MVILYHFQGEISEDPCAGPFQQHSWQLPKSNLGKDESLFNSQHFNKRAHPYQTTGSKVTDFWTKKCFFSTRMIWNYLKWWFPNHIFQKTSQNFDKNPSLSHISLKAFLSKNPLHRPTRYLEEKWENSWRCVNSNSKYADLIGVITWFVCVRREMKSGGAFNFDRSLCWFFRWKDFDSFISDSRCSQKSIQVEKETRYNLVQNSLSPWNER
jgi:hypothetical protein